MRLQVFDSDGSIGGGNKLADTLSKAFFGDGEAAAKIALAKAQIAAQQAHAGYYGAQTGKTQQDTRIEGERHQTNKTLGERAAEEARLRVQPPQPLPIPIPSGTESIRPGGAVSEVAPAPVDLGLRIAAPPPMPVQVAPITPQQTSLYQAQREAEAARARAVAIAGGNAQQVAQGINLQTGGSLLRHPGSPTDARVGATLTTGNLPSTSTVVVPGDTAGVNAAAQATPAKPIDNWSLVNGVPTYTRLNPDGSVVATPATGVTPTPADHTAQPATDLRIVAIQKKYDEGQAITPQEAKDYARDIERTYKTRQVKETDPQTRQTRVYDDYGVLPGGTPHPNLVARRANIAPEPIPPPAPTVAPGSTGAPVVAGETPVSPPNAPPPVIAPNALSPTRVETVPAERSKTEFEARAITSTEKYKPAVAYFAGDITPRNIPQGVMDFILATPGEELSLKVLTDQGASDEVKEYITAAMSALWPGARFDSGAAVQKSEVINEFLMKIPTPGDSQRRINMKMANLAGHVRGIASAAFGGMDTPQYKDFERYVIAKGFDLNRESTERLTDYEGGALKTPGTPGTPAATPGVRTYDPVTKKWSN